ncbi:MAG: rhodanese-like domain-containing protein, partial [Thermoplasmataceae archaeon]
MDTEKLIQLILKKEVTLIDTRKFEDYLKGHIPDSVLAPYKGDYWFHEMSEYIETRKNKIVILTSDEINLDNFREKLKNGRNDIEIINY